MIIIASVLIAICSGIQPIRAQRSDACKDCRDFHKACVKAHSQAACKTDYDICMKHCRQK
jgi:hypothetical protein